MAAMVLTVLPMPAVALVAAVVISLAAVGLSGLVVVRGR